MARSLVASSQSLYTSLCACLMRRRRRWVRSPTLLAGEAFSLRLLSTTIGVAYIASALSGAASRITGSDMPAASELADVVRYLDASLKFGQVFSTFSVASFAAILIIWSRAFGYTKDPPIGTRRAAYWLVIPMGLALLSVACLALLNSLVVGFYNEVAFAGDSRCGCAILAQYPADYFACDTESFLSWIGTFVITCSIFSMALVGV